MPRNVVTVEPRFAGREARERVVADLDEIAPNWRRLFRLYPR